MWTKEKEEMLARLQKERENELEPKREAVRKYYAHHWSGLYGGAALSLMEELIRDPKKAVELLQPLILPGE